jgi:hypothetical protein
LRDLSHNHRDGNPHSSDAGPASHDLGVKRDSVEHDTSPPYLRPSERCLATTHSRSRQLKPDEVQGGTFSITNWGSFGSLLGTPIINQPQVAIRSICDRGLTFDHRLIDGTLADQFMTKLKSILHNWSEEVP